MARITIIGPQGSRERKLLKHNSLGRHPTNTHQVLDRVVSKEHCHIDLVDGHYVLKDLGSLNGTYLNGEKVAESVLEDGDEITMGSTQIVFDGKEDDPGHDTLADSGFERALERVLIATDPIAGRIQTKVAVLADERFVPENMLADQNALRRDYEKLRASYEVTQAIGLEQDVDGLARKILDVAFELLSADRGVVMLYDEEGKELKPRAVRTAEGGGPADAEVLISRTVVDAVLRDKAVVLSHDASIDARFQSAESVIMQGIRSTMGVPLIHGGQVFGIMTLDSQAAANIFAEKDLKLFQTIANQAALAIQNILNSRKLKQEALTRERFQRLLSPAIAEQVMSGEVEVKKGGELREATILFTDIRGFTGMSESYAPHDVVDMLNEYFERMVEIVFRYEGTLDKFIGDELMAIFGAPVAHPDDPVRAVLAALEMQQTLSVFNHERAARSLPPIEIGIGINTGEVVAGYLGSSQALEYTVIGDPVNIASRLCKRAKPGQILISAPTQERVEDTCEVEELDAAKLRGKAKAMKIFQVLGERE